ncbi:DUF6082 family protein [Actinomadura rifamycini]|uniref:DUF6082 family protein n=1 Tax=Actinomadura rifamycini TaxID=31962 RepID=UPI00068696D5|nr:DUF6082 family protein [Actinomadura rifamycini]
MMTVAFGVAATIVLVILSPFVLRELFAGSAVDWPLLSNIGQTYGAVSALLAAGALALLGFSVALQAREVRHAREQAARTAQFELMRVMLDDPVYREVVGWSARDGLAPDDFRRDLYINLLLNWWRMRWEFKDMSEAEVRYAARGDLFSGNAGRDYWRRRGEARLSFVANRRARRFEKIFAEEYEAAVAAGPVGPTPARSEAARGAASRRAGAAVVALGAGAVAGMAWRVLARRARGG